MWPQVALAPPVLHGEWLTELAAEFDLAWASGWGLQANDLVAPILGVDVLPFVPMPQPFVPMPQIPFPPHEKVPAIDASVGSRPAAWIDVVVPEARAWTSNRRAPTKLVNTDHTRGLQRNHVDDLLAWAGTLNWNKRELRLPPRLVDTAAGSGGSR